MISSFPVLESTAHDQPLSIHNRLTQRVCAGPIRPKKIGTTPAETAAKNLVGKIRGGVLTPFPEKLHDILSKAKEEMFEHIVSWQPHGRCFIVHQPEQFVKQVMSRFFKQTKLRSFHRQLHLYGFSRLTEGRDRGGYVGFVYLTISSVLLDVPVSSLDVRFVDSIMRCFCEVNCTYVSA